VEQIVNVVGVSERKKNRERSVECEEGWTKDRSWHKWSVALKSAGLASLAWKVE